jgi:hypothetical protein
MLREKVTSTSLASIGYDEDHAILEVEFRTGEVYQYYDVSIAVYDALMNADSIGAYFSNNIRPAYDFRHIS